MIHREVNSWSHTVEVAEVTRITSPGKAQYCNLWKRGLTWTISDRYVPWHTRVSYHIWALRNLIDSIRPTSPRSCMPSVVLTGKVPRSLRTGGRLGLSVACHSGPHNELNCAQALQRSSFSLSESRSFAVPYVLLLSLVFRWQHCLYCCRHRICRRYRPGYQHVNVLLFSFHFSSIYPWKRLFPGGSCLSSIPITPITFFGIASIHLFIRSLGRRFRVCIHYVVASSAFS